MNTLMARAMSKSARSRQRLGLAALVACLAAAPGVALASAQVSGTAQSVSVDAQNSTLKEVLSALGRNFHLQLQSSANLDKPISGTYHGSLQRIVARLLEGYNFIIQTNQGGLQVTVLGTQGGPSTAVAAVASPSSGQASPSRQTAAGARAVPSSPAPQIAAQAKSTPKSSSSQASSSKSAPPPFVFKVAEGPAPMPTPAPATTKGPMPGPATSQMPMPKPSSAMPSVSPPTATSSAVLPVPTTSKPFPGFSGQPNSSVANGSSPNVAPPMPTPNGSSPTGAPPVPTSPTPAQKP